ncbi:MAG: 6-hydroxymethylpterin diphosphokinase MptE-like protein [Candidatus Geothermarchaeales archaeon]
MRFEVWYPKYREIADRFDYDERADQLAASELDSILGNKAIGTEVVRSLVAGRNVLVLGSGPSLETNLRGITGIGILDRFVLIAADDSVKAMYELTERVPDIVVTDLDGEEASLLRAAEDGAILVVHAHGDNRSALNRLVPRLGRTLGTTQVRPTEKVHNFGGFTDGDRAVFFAAELGPRSITLAGMDFGKRFGRYSKVARGDRPLKVEKLRVGVELLEWLSDQVNIGLYNISEGVRLRGFERVSLEELSLHLSFQGPSVRGVAKG